MRNCENREKNLKSNDDKTVELLNTTKSEINGESNKLAVNKAQLTTSGSSLDNLHFSLSNTNLSSSSSAKKLPLSKKKPKLKAIKL